jgi:hypothetical protein
VNPDKADDTSYRPTRPLTQAEKTKLTQQHFSLSPLGTRAFDLITEVVAQNIKKPGPPNVKQEK